MTNNEYKNITFKAYKTLVNVYKGNKSVSDMVDALTECGIENATENTVIRLVSVMSTATMTKGVIRLKSIATFRKGIKDGLETIVNAEVEYKEPAAPANTVKTVHYDYVILFKNGQIQLTNDKEVADTMRTLDYVDAVRDCRKAA